MRFLLASTLLALSSVGVHGAAAEWGFKDGAVTVAAKGSEGVAEKFTSSVRVKSRLSLDQSSSIKVVLTAEEDGKAKRPHQAFLVVRETESGLEAPFPLTMKESGKGSVKLMQKDLPVQLVRSKKPLEAKIVLGSFGQSKAIVASVFDLDIKKDSRTGAGAYEAPLRYGKREEIRHIFRADPSNPPKIVSLVFAGAVLATLPALLAGWLFLGANLSHAGKALGYAPVAHVVFYGSIVAMEGVFFLYYSGWNLFQTLPAAGAVGAVAFLSGNSALGEVQRRRLAGER